MSTAQYMYISGRLEHLIIEGAKMFEGASFEDYLFSGVGDMNSNVCYILIRVKIFVLVTVAVALFTARFRRLMFSVNITSAPTTTMCS